jgi:hypothetical protein
MLRAEAISAQATLRARREIAASARLLAMATNTLIAGEPKPRAQRGGQA